MTPQEIIDNRERQIQAWIANGFLTEDQLNEINRIWDGEED